MGGRPWRRDLALQKANRERIDADPPHCRFCGRVIPKPRRYKPSVAYCDSTHREKAKRERMKVARAAESVLAREMEGTVVPFPEDKVRRGQVYERIKAELNDVEWFDWVSNRFSDAEVAIRVGATPQAVGMARKAAINDQFLEMQAENFVIDDHYVQLLGPSDADMVELLAKNPEAFEQKLVALVDAFVAWRTEFFSVGFERAYITKDVHKRWIRATLKTIYTGGRLLILSPPRHGKTDLLIHFCVWLICRNPNIRILWVGPNGDIAENCLGQVRDLLETHDALRDAYLPEGQTWAPTRRGTGLWQRTRFTVANRSVTLKQPTMWCTGVGGKILSIDADFIVVDDPADPDASYTPGGRAKIENWFKVKLITRKMFHTGLAMISSRVHPEDLYSEFVESESWEVVVDKAHDQMICHRGLWDPHTDIEACVLFPEINPLEYLREQYDVVGPVLFEMMYLNQPRPDGLLIFDPDIIRERCLDYTRDIGLGGIRGSYRLIAGLDPAARGVQAAFLWAVQLPSPEEEAAGHRDPYRPTPTETYYMVDLETQRAGGMEGVVKVMREWAEKYDCRYWVIEDNSYKQGVNGFDDPRLKTVKAQLGLEIKPTSTGSNKHDPDFGVAAQASLYHEGKVNLPYASSEAVRKTDNFIKQLVNFTGETGRSKNQSDILMASWFPHATVIRKWKREMTPRRIQATSEFSFPGWQPTADNEIPWGATTYPYTLNR